MGMTTSAPTVGPTMSPSFVPTNSAPSVAPTVYPSVSPTQVPTSMTSRANDHVIIAIKGTELLGGVIILLLLAVVILMCIQFRKRKISQSKAMLETLDMADNKTDCVSEGGLEIGPQQSTM